MPCDVYGIIDKAFGLAPGKAKAQPDATLLDLGADSMGLARIAAGIRTCTGKNIGIAELFSFSSIDSVIKMARKGGKSNKETPLKPEAYFLLSFDKDTLYQTCQQVDVRAGCHQQWLDDQRRRGSNVELIDT